MSDISWTAKNPTLDEAGNRTSNLARRFVYLSSSVACVIALNVCVVISLLWWAGIVE